MRFLRSFSGNTNRASRSAESFQEKINMLNLLRDLVAGQRYSFGEPWQLTHESLSAVVPLIRFFSKERAYFAIQELPEDSIAVTDSGHIGQVNVRLENVAKPVFIRAGTVFKGQGTQSRTSEISTILEAGKEYPISTFCVHASHGISSGSCFKAYDVVPRKVEDVLMSQGRNQSKVWSATTVRASRAEASLCPTCGSSNLLQNYEAELVCVNCGHVIAPLTAHTQPLPNRISAMRFQRVPVMDNLTVNLEEMARFNQRVKDTLSEIPADLKDQVGMAIIDSAGVLGLEMFDHPDSWMSFSRSIVRNYADILVKERSGEGLFSLRTERIPRAIRQLLDKAQGLSETSMFRNQLGQTKMLSGELVGEYTTLGSAVIHLALKRKTAA